MYACSSALGGGSSAVGGGSELAMLCCLRQAYMALMYFGVLCLDDDSCCIIA